MKKLFIIAMMSLVSMGSFAQEAGEMFIKPMVGGTLATLRGDDVNDHAKLKFGLIAGAEFGYMLADQFGVTAGLLYSMQGAADDRNSDHNINMDYLNIPILANYYIIPGLAVKAGIQPGFLMRAKSDDVDIKDTFKSLDLAIPLGVSYEFSDFVIDARYNFSLTKLPDHGDGKVYNSVIQLTIGYKIPL